MRRFYQKEWFGIDFKSFVKLDSQHIADATFYEKFYDEFYKKYSSYDEMPQDWKISKKLIAEYILQQTNNNYRMLSIGCGNGYIEFLLKKENRNIIAVEPSLKSTRFLRQFSDVKLYNGYFPECLYGTGLGTFDFGYLIATDYVFNKIGLVDFIKNVKEFPIKRFLLISVCVYDKYSFLQLSKDVLKRGLSLIKLIELGQFWGYKRTSDEFTQAFIKAGYKNIESGYLENRFFWIRGN